ncbi:hypothetical protein ACLOJK_003964 [Asimina triloba]
MLVGFIVRSDDGVADVCVDGILELGEEKCGVEGSRRRKREVYEFHEGGLVDGYGVCDNLGEDLLHLVARKTIRGLDAGECCTGVSSLVFQLRRIYGREKENLKE